MRFYVRNVGVWDCSQLTTILCVSLVSPTPPFPRSHHNALQVRVRICVIGWCRHVGRLGRTSIFSYCSNYASPGKQRGLDVLPDPKFSPAHNQRRFVLFCVKGLTDIRSLNLLGPTWTSFVSDIESFFMTIRTKCPFVIEWIANTTVIWIDNDMQDVLRRQNIICSRECNVNEVRDPPRARIWRKIRESVSSVYRKTSPNAKTWAKVR